MLSLINPEWTSNTTYPKKRSREFFPVLIPRGEEELNLDFALIVTDQLVGFGITFVDLDARVTSFPSVVVSIVVRLRLSSFRCVDSLRKLQPKEVSIRHSLLSDLGRSPD
jgi:hypothetical protein